MTDSEVNVITGAFGYTGKYITRRLLTMGKEVRTLTGHPDHPNPFGEQVHVFPFDFENPGALVKSLQGVTTLYNTYWIRFSHGTTTFDSAVKNTLGSLQLVILILAIGLMKMLSGLGRSMLPSYSDTIAVDNAIFASCSSSTPLA